MQQPTDDHDERRVEQESAVEHFADTFNSSEKNKQSGSSDAVFETTKKEPTAGGSEEKAPKSTLTNSSGKKMLSRGLEQEEANHSSPLKPQKITFENAAASNSAFDPDASIMSTTSNNASSAKPMTNFI